MTVVNVVPVRPGLAYEDILTGRAVRAITWQDWAQLCTWLLGRGAQLAASHAPGAKLAASSTYRTHLYARRNYASIQRVYVFWIRGVSSATDVDISIDGGAAVTYQVAYRRTAVSPIVVTQDLASQSTSEATLRYDITPSSAGAVWLDGVTVYEVPRVQLDDATAEIGVLTSPFAAGQPIRQADFANGATALKDGTYGRRCLFSWGVPYQLGGVTTTLHAWTTSSGTLTDVFALHPPLLARKGVPGETQRSVRVAYLAMVSGGASGQVYVGTTSRTPTLAGTLSSTPAQTSATQIIDVEDPSDASGLQGGSFDGLRMQASITSGVGSVYIFGVSVYET